MTHARPAMNDSKRHRLLTVAVIIAAAAGFVFDIYMELGVAAPVVYVGVVWLSWATRSTRMVYIVAFICTGLAVVGLMISPQGGEVWKVLVNRSLSISALWITAVLADRHLGLLKDATLRADEIEEQRLRIQVERDQIADRVAQHRDRARVMFSITEDLQSKRQQLEKEVESRKRAEDQFRRVVEAAPSGMVMIDSSGAIQLVNSETEALFQYSRGELIGLPVELLIPERFQSGHPELRVSYLDTPTVRAMGHGRELFGRRKDGSEFPVEIGLNPVEVSGEQFVLSSVVDITERRIHETALRESEERVRSIVDTALDAVITMSQNGQVTGWNPQAEVIFGWTAEEALSQSVSELIIPQSRRPDHCAGLEQFLKTGESRILNQRLELTAKRKSGEEFPIELTISALRLGTQYEFSAFINDITERKAAEAEIRRINEEVRQKNEEMQQFVYTVSHDLKSPLVTLEGFVGFLREELEDNNPEEAQKCLERIERSTERMGQLITDLLQLSRVGLIRNDPEPVDLNDLARELTDDLGSQIEKSGFSLTVQPELPTIFADRVRIAQVLVNLITNALKYGAAADSPEIIIGSEEENGETTIFVQDNGQGIAPEHQERVFRPFERLQTDQEGTGIGLAIVNRIVQVNGGRVTIQSSPGEGARFCLVFPKEAQSAGE